MITFRVIYKDGQYKTFNEKGTAIDVLWRDHRCLICQAQLYREERTFCAICKFVEHRTVVENAG